MATVDSKTSAKVDELVDDNVVGGYLAAGQLYLTTRGGSEIQAGDLGGRDFRLEEHGAVGDGVTDDQAAINATLALMQPGDRLVLNSDLVFAHSSTIDLATPGIQVIGGTLKGLDSAHCALYLTAPGVVVRNTTKTVAWTVRTNTQASHSFVMRGTNQVLDHVTADGAGGVGIFAFGASDFLIDAPLAKNAGADGIHVTFGSTRGRIRSPRVYACGDDHLAFVSYAGDPAPVVDVQATDVIVDCTTQTNGRGIAVVGGEDIIVDGYKIIKSWGAAVYINIETAYPSRAIRRVRFKHGELVQPNRGWGASPTPVNHGGILISNQGPTNEVDDVMVQDVIIKDSGTSMPGVGRMVAFQAPSTGPLTNSFVDDVKIRGTICANVLANPNGIVNPLGGVDYGRLSSAPVASGSSSGATYFDTTLNQMGYHNGSVWVYYGSSSDPGFKVLANNVQAADNSNYPISDLSIPVANAATYVVDGMVFYEASTAGDLKLYFLIPSGADLQWGGVGLGAAVTTGLQGSFSSFHISGGVNTAAYGGVAIGTKQYVVLRGLLTTFANSGNIQLGFGQQTTDAGNPTVLKAKSYIRATRVA